MDQPFSLKEARVRIENLESHNAVLLNDMQMCKDAVAKYTETINDLQLRLRALEDTPAASSAHVAPAVNIVHNADEDTVKTVTDILGPQFQVIKEPHATDAFLLTIIPPEHLKENENDRRVKVIRTYEGLNGVKEFADKVKEFCTAFAAKKGVPYTA